jgi:hypothetical protein
MKKLAFLLPGALLLLILSACTSVKRFKSVDYRGEDNTLVNVELFNTRMASEPLAFREKNLWTLSANAQSHLVQILDERYPDNEQFINALSGSFGTGTSYRAEMTRKDLRMVFTISKDREYSQINNPDGRYSPADRIEYYRLSVRIPDHYRLRFNEWNRYVTEYGEFDISDVSFSRNLDLSLEGAPGGVDLGAGAGLGRNEKQEISKRYLKLNGSISDRQVVMEAEGTREVDLTGNVTADVSLQFEGFPELVMVPVFASDEAGNTVLSDLDLVHVVVPAISDAPDTIFAELSLKYIYRHVASGWKTFAEWDDHVEYYQGSFRRELPLFLKKDYLPQFFCIGTEQEGKEALILHKSPDREYLLQFRDYTQAAEFLEWIRNPGWDPERPLSIAGNALLYKGESISPEQVRHYQLKAIPVF